MSYAKFQAIREEIRRKFVRASDEAQAAAAVDDMEKCSLYSTESARYQEAFAALNRVAPIVEELEERIETLSKSAT